MSIQHGCFERGFKEPSGTCTTQPIFTFPSIHWCWSGPWSYSFPQHSRGRMGLLRWLRGEVPVGCSLCLSSFNTFITVPWEVIFDSWKLCWGSWNLPGGRMSAKMFGIICVGYWTLGLVREHSHQIRLSNLLADWFNQYRFGASLHIQQYSSFWNKPNTKTH